MNGQANGQDHPPGAIDPETPIAAEPTPLTMIPNADCRPCEAAAAGSASLAVPAGRSDVVVHVEVIRGGFTNVKVPVAICPRYQGMPLAGPAKAFDCQLDSWLTRISDLGIIGSGLGQLYPIHLSESHAAGRVKVDALLLAGMGEPGHFAADDLRYLMSNVTVVVKSMGLDHLSSMLIGTFRNELVIPQAVRGFLEGILDGYERFRVIADALTVRKDHFQELAARPLFISLVDTDERKADAIFAAFECAAQERSIPGFQLEVSRGDNVDPDPNPESSGKDVDPNVPVTMLRVTRSSNIRRDAPAPSSGAATASDTEVFEFSGLSDVAAVTVRENELNGYLVRKLPDRLITARTAEKRQEIGMFFANYLIPDDFRRLADGQADLTFIVDETTAAFPWEMAAHKRYSKTNFLGTSVAVSRQFRTMFSPPPGSPPPLNRVHKVLIIADPARGARFALPHAREEGQVVIDVLNQAARAWAGEYEFKVTVRIGPRPEPEDDKDDALESMLEGIRMLGDWVESVDTCDPLELALLIVNEHFDVIHYAGHGAFEPKTGRAGWVLDAECVLSAQEIFRVRQVPRLVFANACFSAATTDHNEQRGKFVSLAQAFFARGIPNYIGTGWNVNDECARECARWFYSRVLGLGRPNHGDAPIGKSPPATIGESLRDARHAVYHFNKDSSSWGAYQHYGRVNDKLLPFPNTLKTDGQG